ncbi:MULTISPECIES: RagB/SusD family nutrient uptake outer membrane protein [unclassified Bacteroides]|uniref:RagB/SusD family nutrient uptake outer membrane protein n=1 Tax=unclassified Bacteroides TaxID=2646097 RepID=UPI00168AB9BE|nr:MULTISPECIES: RagB/SusD family nutrient uptake outer membrane protein [unclassified Bacteroides]MBD3590835.1 RagB/SusD family nutrient uptake outer membrane protein [Bacteroides sp. GM023]
MKKYNYIIVSLLTSLFITSCNDYFDQVPDDRLSLKEIFTTRDGALKYLSNVYTFLPDEFNQRQVHETSLYRTPGPWTAASDEAEWTSSGNKAKLINNNSIDATENTMVLYRWKSWFSGIHEAAVFTEYVDLAPLTATERNQWKAEARALRAIYYFYLVRTYGPVPLLDSDYAMDTPSDELQLSRSTVDACFNFIVSELKAAQKDGLMDDASTDKVSGYGRIDQSIAQAFIIEALTYRASWLFNGECTYYANLANPDGTKLFPSKPDEATKRANWQKVIDECKTFFQNYGSRYHLMYTDKKGVAVTGADALTFNPMESYRRGMRTLFSEVGTNKEMIFYRLDNAAETMQYDRTPNKSGNTDDYRGGSLLGATQEIVDAYFMRNGESPVTGYASDGITPIINEESQYVENGISTTDYTAADGTVYAQKGTRMMYVNRDPRFYADITFSNSKWFEGTEGGYTIDFTYSGNCGKKQGSNDYTSTGYLVRKNMDSGNRKQNLICVLLRLTNIYFDYVEALANVEPTNEDIWTYMNLIRKRAGIPGYGETQNLIKPTTTKEVMELIRKEKRVELSFENCRYFDVRRWGLVDEHFNKPIHGMNVNYDGNDFFKRTEIIKRVFTRQYFFPIPQSEIDIDKNLVQNTGF